MTLGSVPESDVLRDREIAQTIATQNAMLTAGENPWFSFADLDAQTQQVFDALRAGTGTGYEFRPFEDVAALPGAIADKAKQAVEAAGAWLGDLARRVGWVVALALVAVVVVGGAYVVHEVRR